MELSVAERLMLIPLLQRMEGDVLTLKIVRELLGEIGFSEDEYGKLGLKQEDGRTTWEAEVVPPKEVVIGPTAKQIIADRFRIISERHQLALAQLSLYERFVETVGAEEVSAP